MTPPAVPPTATAVGSDLLVVVVAYHAPDLLERCLDTLADDFDVVVVDNSSDPAVADVAGRHRCGYVDPGRNLGFAGGVNLGAAAGGAVTSSSSTPTPSSTRRPWPGCGRPWRPRHSWPPSPRPRPAPPGRHPTASRGPSPPRPAAGWRRWASDACAGIPPS